MCRQFALRNTGLIGLSAERIQATVAEVQETLELGDDVEAARKVVMSNMRLVGVGKMKGHMFADNGHVHVGYKHVGYKHVGYVHEAHV